MAFYKVEPFGDDRADLRMGYAIAQLANSQRRRGSQILQPDQFIPKLGHDRPADSEELSERIKSALRAFSNGKSRKPDRPRRR